MLRVAFFLLDVRLLDLIASSTRVRLRPGPILLLISTIAVVASLHGSTLLLHPTALHPSSTLLDPLRLRVKLNDNDDGDEDNIESAKHD